MQLNVIRREKNELRIELLGEGHTFCIALQEMLLKDEDIDFTGYNISHPLIASPQFYVRMKKNIKPENALIKASKNLTKNLDNLQKAFRKASKIKESH